MLIKRGGDEWHEPDVSSYQGERALRDILAASPHLLPNSTGPLVATTELPVSSGSIDLVAIEPSGQIVLCECKLDANEESRRKVVGQLLSYAGAVWQLEYDAFTDSCSRRLGRPLVDAIRAIASPNWDEEEFRDALEENLANGHFRLIVAVDQITEQLKNTILYLNRHSAPGIEVLALELKYTRDGDVEILVPESYGEEVAPPKPRRKTWDEEGLFEVLEEGCKPEGVAAVRELWRFCKERSARPEWGGGHGAGASIYLLIDGEPQPLLGIYGYTDGLSTVAINFECGWRT